MLHISDIVEFAIISLSGLYDNSAMVCHVVNFVQVMQYKKVTCKSMLNFQTSSHTYLRFMSSSVQTKKENCLITHQALI